MANQERIALIEQKYNQKVIDYRYKYWKKPYIALSPRGTFYIATKHTVESKLTMLNLRMVDGLI